MKRLKVLDKLTFVLFYSCGFLLVFSSDVKILRAQKNSPFSSLKEGWHVTLR